jgi:signal transduction histidine kinase
MLAMSARSLLNLPALVHDSTRWQLPLCDATAQALTTALCETDLAHRAALLSKTLAVDPALAVWTVWHWARELTANQQTESTLSITTLGEWLAQRLLGLLDWKTDKPISEVPADQHGRFAALLAESVSAAHDALRPADTSDLNTEPRYLATLTGRWQQWLAASQADPTSFTPPPIHWPCESTTAASTVSPEAKAAGDEAWRLWLTEIPGVQLFLPSLAGQLRRLAELDASFEHRLQTAKLDALKEFAYGAGHELNNPLANIASRAQTLLKEEHHPERKRRLAAINSQAFRAHEMLADLMLFARPPQPVWQRVDLVPLVDEVLAAVDDLAARQHTALHAPTRREPIYVEADGVQLRIALRALCINALEAINQGGNISVEICRGDDSIQFADPSSGLSHDQTVGDFAQIAVTDDGPGISPQTCEKIFDPFFSGREAGRGLGFGLSKCWRIVNSHRGRVDVHSAPGQGATFTISLPLATAKPAQIVAS